MIGKIILGQSFNGCIGYCMEDKRGLTEEQKLELSLQDGLQHKDRAEVIHYNSCYGTTKELAKQFYEVRKLSSRTEKPVLHITLRLAPGETLSKDQLVEIGQACANEFEFDKNQYLCVLHKDTKEQHIHIVANRVGYDGKAVNLSNNYRRMADFCRRVEKQYHLQEVLNPRSFLSKEQRQLPRHDARKEQLKHHIRSTLQEVTTYTEFEHKMKSLGYQVLKGRGISFIDQKKVKIKGSEIGFSLSRIERALALREELNNASREEKVWLKMAQVRQTNRDLSPGQRLLVKNAIERFQETALYKMQDELLKLLFEPEKNHNQSVDPQWLYEEQRRKKKKKNQMHR